MAIRILFSIAHVIAWTCNIEYIEFSIAYVSEDFIKIMYIASGFGKSPVHHDNIDVAKTVCTFIMQIDSYTSTPCSKLYRCHTGP
uniref:Secreted protein n=1 Tax=Oryza sativa subsp. japonica TaxID=39947 RepID=Q2QS56_ORYSJ|nr:hypothetical protein LOC_Os12g25270 [Oryza sativa Japonica Group]